MNLVRRRALVLLIATGLLLAACGSTPTLSPVSPSPTAEPITAPSVSPSPLQASPSPLPASATVPAASPSASPQGTPPVVPTLPATGCRLGGGLRQETGSILVKYQNQPGLVMAATMDLAQTYFPQLKGWIRVLGAPSLDTLQKKVEWASQVGLEYEGLAYGLETGQATPQAEWQDLIGSTQKARALADKYGKLLVMGPGYQLMSQNEDKYPGMAALADIWVLQTQRLQINPPGTVYQQGVERVVKLIRSDNPDVAVWAQITLPPDREPNAQQWLDYRQSITGLVEGTFVGVYTWKRVDPQVLVATMDAIFASACGDGQ